MSAFGHTQVQVFVMSHNNGFDPATAAAPVPSPCISVCLMQEGLCKGCLRTIDEIAHWGKGGEEYRRDVWTRIRQREEQVVLP